MRHCNNVFNVAYIVEELYEFSKNNNLITF